VVLQLVNFYCNTEEVSCIE